MYAVAVIVGICRLPTCALTVPVAVVKVYDHLSIPQEACVRAPKREYFTMLIVLISILIKC